ncbi:MAG TPA: hypothetical protein VNX88_17860 [Terriglobales bacterium]|nr:hypothetical protein [Terriglobales bacterium]
MRLFRTLLVSAALLSSSALTFGQDYHSWGYQDRDDRRIYQRGYEEGRSDAQNRRRFNPDSNRYRESDDRRAYRQGYEAGYNAGRHGNAGWGRDHDRDNDRNEHNGGYGNGGYGNGGYGNGSSIARQNGYRDGVNDGRKDRATGHSFRPTQGDNYKGAPGYSSSMGDRQQYKDAYRQSYQQGYQQGYR